MIELVSHCRCPNHSHHSRHCRHPPLPPPPHWIHRTSSEVDLDRCHHPSHSRRCCRSPLPPPPLPPPRCCCPGRNHCHPSSSSHAWVAGRNPNHHHRWTLQHCDGSRLRHPPRSCRSHHPSRHRSHHRNPRTHWNSMIPQHSGRGGSS